MLKIVFMGTPEIAATVLRALLPVHDVVLAVAQPDKPAGRGKKLVKPPVAEVAEAAGVPVVQPRSARTEEFRQTLVDTGADVGVVVAYGKILPLGVLEAFPHGCLNVHASILPAYRGAAPVQWALINGETETGVTIMRLDEGMDTGPMLLKGTLPIDDGDTVSSLLGRLAPLGAELLLQALSQLEAGTLSEEPQDDAAATYAPMLKKSDGVIDWSQEAAAVCSRVRGVDPWPGATTTFGELTLKLFAARPTEGRGKPGEVLAADRRGLVVACGDGACAVAEVQGPGKRRMPAADYVRGNPIPAGTILGQ